TYILDNLFSFCHKDELLAWSIEIIANCELRIAKNKEFGIQNPAFRRQNTTRVYSSSWLLAPEFQGSDVGWALPTTKLTNDKLALEF
ncbi:MAG: hypothetical protein PVI73_09370, partial [Syntrophobacterales bacterium]